MTDRMRIALVCYHVQDKYQHQTVKDEDGPLLAFLQSQGLDIHREIWNDSEVDWKRYDVVILKAPWDYHDQLDKFHEWLDALGTYGCRILNPVEVVKWNSDKRYLTEIATSGFKIIPTLAFEAGTRIDLAALSAHFGTNTLVFKPSISAGAKDTFKVHVDRSDETYEKIRNLISMQGFLVQEFTPEVQSEGEWSFLFFNGEFSHAILKTPGKGDFRVQHYFGGTIQSPSVEGHQIEQAKAYVDRFAKGCLYARVDGIMRKGEFHLMELELIEPLLFLAFSSDGERAAQQRYYNALNQQLAKLK